WVVGPDGGGEGTGHAASPLPIAGHERDPVSDQPDQRRMVEPRRAGVEDLHGRVVPRGGRGLRGEEDVVARPEPLAHAHPCPCTTCPLWDSDRGPPAGPLCPLRERPHPCADWSLPSRSSCSVRSP